MQKKIEYKTKTVREKQTILRKEKQQVTKIILVKKKQKKPITKVVRKTRMVKVTKMEQKKRQQKKIKMVTRTLTRPQLKYVLKSVKRRAVKMVKQMKSTQKEVPKTIPIPIGDLDKLLQAKWKDCGCFQKNCQCYGQAGCGCSYPTCGCAPTMISPTETEIIVVE